MKPTKPDDEHAVVDLLDVLLERGVMLQADVVVSVAGVPLVGVNLRAAIAGMATMTEYGLLESWDEELRERAAERSAARDERAGSKVARERAADRREAAEGVHDTAAVDERPPGHSMTDRSRSDREPTEGRPAGHPPTATRPAETPQAADRDSGPTAEDSPTVDGSLTAGDSPSDDEQEDFLSGDEQDDSQNDNSSPDAD